MKVISINSLPKFDIRLNGQYELVMPSVIRKASDPEIPILEMEYPSDWRSFQGSNQAASLVIMNLQNTAFDKLIDFDNHALCEKIERLTIYGAIGHVSDKIKQLVSLISLHLYDVSSISPAISSLTKLEELVLERCQSLNFIPFELYEIPNLKKLTINSLSYYENLSPRINRLTNLEHLTLKDHFPFLSEEISQLTQLKCLAIERPRACIYEIPNLEVLHIGLHDPNLLKGIAQLRHLKELWLEAHALSEELKELTSLKYLMISNYAGTALPDLSPLSELEVLVLHGCSELTAIPDFVFKLPNLKYLGLRCLNSLTSIPAEINQIPHLKYLDLTKEENTAFYEIPEFRSGLQVYQLSSRNEYERIN